MSDSRLEKFIYAICSMDVSDLPVPLSRIEKLWNCLITGETPDFEPISRNEKYLMAMLDRYDISNLPTPMSRGEKLLYKIAVGETDLSDVPGYLSRYEELLKYLIENGVLSDFEYVLYTLNQSLSTLYATIEKPVKSAILSGQTLVNLIKFKSRASFISYNNGTAIFTNPTGAGNILFSAEMFKPSTKYIFRANFKCDSNWDYKIRTDLYPDNFPELAKFTPTTQGSNCYQIFTTPSNIDGLESFRIYVSKAVNGVATISNVMLLEYQEGMENWDIPYFEGMASCKMPVLTTTGKNLIDLKNAFSSRCTIDTSNNTITGTDSYNDVQFYVTLEKGKTYRFSANGEYGATSQILLGRCQGYVGDKEIQSLNINNKFTYLGETGEHTLHIIYFKDVVSNIQLEEGSTVTTYEPFKSNILTVNEDVTLRGVGDVKDELNVATGELTERIGEIKTNNIINEITILKRYTDKLIIRLPLTLKTTTYSPNLSCPYLLCDKLKTLSFKRAYADNTEIGVYVHEKNPDFIYMCILNSNLVSNDLGGIKEYLKANPSTIQYKLLESTVKTVDLTTVDQDGQPTKLKTFNDITHVEIKADNLIPSVDVEVATKINETLSTMGLEHHELSETQNKLSQTIDEQTENTDATMMATTEIYEQTL